MIKNTNPIFTSWQLTKISKQIFFLFWTHRLFWIMTIALYFRVHFCKCINVFLNVNIRIYWNMAHATYLIIQWINSFSIDIKALLVAHEISEMVECYRSFLQCGAFLSSVSVLSSLLVGNEVCWCHSLKADLTLQSPVHGNRIWSSLCLWRF